MTPGGVVAARLLAAFAPQDRVEAARILAGWVRVPQLAVTDVVEILAGYGGAPSDAPETGGPLPRRLPEDYRPGDAP